MAIDDISDKYTPEGLPKLTKETINVYGRDMLARNPTVMKEWLQEIQDENPWVATFIATNANQYPPEQRAIAFMDMVSLYRVLKIQAEKYQLEDSGNRG
jgi:hypothetical protein